MKIRVPIVDIPFRLNKLIATEMYNYCADKKINTRIFIEKAICKYLKLDIAKTNKKELFVNVYKNLCLAKAKYREMAEKEIRERKRKLEKC